MHRLWDIGNNFMAQTQNLYALESYLHETLLGSEHRCAAWTGCGQHAWTGCGQHVWAGCGQHGWTGCEQHAWAGCGQHEMGVDSMGWVWTAWAVWVGTWARYVQDGLDVDSMGRVWTASAGCAQHGQHMHSKTGFGDSLLLSPLKAACVASPFSNATAALH